MKKLFKNLKSQGGVAPILLLITIVGIISFLLLANTSDFKSKLFSFLYSKPSSYAAGTFNLIGTDPYAAAQSTAQGKILATLYPFNNKIYIGYGDYGANTGPIQIAPYDPSTNTFSTSLLSAQTEEIDNYRQIGSNLLATFIDPQGGLQNVAYANGEPWSQPTTQGVDGVHIFDVVTLTGTDLYAVGSAYSGSGVAASVWRSIDGGVTWTTSLHEEPVSGIAGDFARFYFAGVYNGKLYVQASDYYGTLHPNSKVFDSTSWTNGPSLATATACSAYMGWRPVVFAGKMVYKTWENPGWGYLKSFDGTKDNCLLSSAPTYDYAIDGAYFYVLDYYGAIKRTTDLVNWQDYATAPVGSRSLAILNNILYVGTIDSKLYSYSEPTNLITPSPTPTPTPSPSTIPSPSPSETVPPTVSITSPANGATVTRNSTFTISANASDNVAVARVEFYTDNSLKCTDTSSPYTCTTKIAGKPGGSHTITAKAYDTSGNTASNSVTVTAR